MKTCSCGENMTKNTVDWIGVQKNLAGDPILELYNCPSCHTTHALKIITKIADLPLYECLTCGEPTIFKGGCNKCEESND